MTAAALAAAPVAAAIATGCAHCGLPVPAGLETFCCAGCETVHRALVEGGLGAWYELAAGAALGPAKTTDRSYAELDDPAFHARHVETIDARTCRTPLYLEDLRCTACVWLVEGLARRMPGVREVRVDLGRGRADVTFEPTVAPLSGIARALDRVGHPVHPFRGVDRDAARRREDRALLIKLGVAGAAAGNVMLLAIGLYAGLFADMTSGDEALFRWASMLVAVPALSYAATPFFATALRALAARRLHLDLPISIGIVAGLVGGTVNVLRDAGEIYFDSLAMLVFLLLVARWVQLRHHRRASSAAEVLLALTPARARRVRGDAVDIVSLEAIAIGDRVRVLAGEPFPVDGTVASGRSTVDAGLLTGESAPVEIEPGTPVFSGTVNLVAPVDVSATATGEATRLGLLVARLDELARRRAPIERFVDRVAGRFVVVVGAVALATLAGWALAGAPLAGVEHAMALLIVTCPCALALATPLSVAVALGRAARRGVLVKGADALERLATPGVMVLDKTGTVTAGSLEVVAWHGDAGGRSLAAALEQHSLHPVARAIVAGEGGMPGAARVEREELGRGIRGYVGDRSVAVGSPTWVATVADVPADMVGKVHAIAGAGDSPIVVAVDGRAVAVAALRDPIRPDAAAAVAQLAAGGWTIELLSGDDPRVVARVGRALGLRPERCTGGVSPEGKLARIEALRAVGPVVMVGDGVNDAAALAAATCGVAVHGSAEASIEAADVCLRRPGVAAIVELVDGARATLATIRRNLRLSLVYNLAAGLFAVSGLIHPLIAAVLMPASSLTVLVSSTRSRAFRSPSP